MAQTQRISKNNTVVLCEGNKTTVILHQTPVVTVDYDARTVTYNTGGWLTATTIARLVHACNELDLPFRVSRAGGILSGHNYRTSHAFSTPSDLITLPF